MSTTGPPPPESKAQPAIDTVARLAGLLEVTRLVRSETDLETLLPAIAAAVCDSMGFGVAVISLYRPAWDDFRVETVHGSEEARAALLGHERTWEEWEPLMDAKFERQGCYLLPWDQFDWSQDKTLSWVPAREPSDDPDAWHPEDALFVPLRHADGHLLGVMSVDEPVSGLRPSEEDLRVLSALAEHAAQAVQDAQAAAEAARHRTALESLLHVSVRLTETRALETLLLSVCEGIRSALGFANVSVELLDAASGRMVPKAAVGWTVDEIEGTQGGQLMTIERLLEPGFEVEGCYLIPGEDARTRLGLDRPAYESAQNGRGPHAWNHHWLLIPLHDRTRGLIGVIWVDEPVDRLVPSRDRLQALRMFANQATTAVSSAMQFEQMRFLADHDPLTRLGNRRAFTARLAEEVSRAARYGQGFALIVFDINGFKALNDANGHHAGDEALEAIGELLLGTLRRSDAAFRLGGDEFALILEESGEDQARGVIDRIADGMGLLEVGQGSALDASFGVAIARAGGAHPEALLRAADAAMYDAKRAGTRMALAPAA
ncbi:MAG TPA: diguanylate cyclase [Solirubrobacteraceae bacterium]|nr:diguanylate cyclase [Solirubrobacteraceae bacterium]